MGLSCDCYSYLFWSDGTNSNAKIERSDLSGGNRRVLVSSAQGLVSPTTLVVDFSSQKLYWLDSAAEKIGHVNFDGSQSLTQTISGLSQVSAMTVYKVRTEILEVTSMTEGNSYCWQFCRHQYYFHTEFLETLSRHELHLTHHICCNRLLNADPIWPLNLPVFSFFFENSYDYGCHDNYVLLYFHSAVS